MKQRLHANLAPIDVLTRLDLEEVADKHFSAQTRERFRGIDSARIPGVTANGNGGTIQVAAIGASDGTAGPEQGDVWLLRRALIVSSNLNGDPARYLLFRGSTPSDIVGGYQPKFLLDGMANNGGFATVVVTPAFPNSNSAIQNPYPFPVTVVITNNGATISAVTVNGTLVGGGPGTYIVPAAGSIAVTYTVATPAWTWTNANPFQTGQLVNIAYNAPNKGVLLQPGEQIYAQVYGSSSGVTYSLIGEAIRCPAEMKGKLLG